MRNAIVTGGSRGIGRAVALKLAEQGMGVLIAYKSSDDLAADTVAQIKAKGVNAVSFKGDISDFDTAASCVKMCVDELGSLDVLINNAGITRDGIAMRMNEEDFDAVIKTNLKSAFNMCRHALRPMARQKWGRIVNISSVAGTNGNAGQINYSASKAGVIGITKSLAREMAPKGITVNAVAPGLVKTDMTASMNDAAREQLISMVPLKRMAEPAEIAEAVSFFVAASYVTGQVLRIDGGLFI